MQTIPLQQAQSQLSEIVSQLTPGSEWIITDHDLPVARLLPAEQKCRQPRQPGSAIGILTIKQDDNEHLADFQDYMP
jgi:antitoxin (DNA-binding transcriptional repressor) of toxin-antitoxin stability system